MRTGETQRNASSRKEETRRNTLIIMARVAFAAILITIGLIAVVHGHMSRGLLHIKGKVLCAGCPLNELRRTASAGRQLYQLTHEQGQVVVDIRSVNGFPAWHSFSWPGDIRVRARDKLFHKLVAEENWFKEVEITGLLSTTKALDIFDVKIGT